MASDGFGFFYSKLGLNINNLAFYYNFAQPDSVVPAVSGNSDMFGIIEGLPDLWDVEGSGSFESGGIRVNDFNTLKSKNWTYLIIPQRVISGTNVLLSTLSSGYPSEMSGLVFGLDGYNSPYVSVANSNGYLFSHTFDLNISNKNILGLTKAGNSLTCFYWDAGNLSSRFSTINFPISCNLNNFNNLTIGRSDSGLFSPLNGYIDEFAAINSTLNSRQFEILSSGFVRGPYVESLVPNTGFSFGAHCSDSGYFTGVDPNVVYTKEETESEIDYEFLKTFQKSGVKYLPCQEVSSFHCVTFEENPIIRLNEGLFFDSVEGFFRTQESFNFSDLSFFYNGLFQTKISDYTYSSRYLLKSGSQNLPSVVDAEPNSYTVLAKGVGEMAFGENVAEYTENSLLFFNGFNLISGADYIPDAGFFSLLTNDFASSSGDLVIVEYDKQIKYHSNGKFIPVNFYDNDIMCFVDRKRVEIQSVKQMSSLSPDFITGSPSCFSGQEIYGNEGGYFNE